MLKFLLAVSVFFLLSTVHANAADHYNECTATADASSTSTEATKRFVSTGQFLCFDFSGTEDSDAIEIRSPSGLICFDPDVTTEGAATAEVHIRYCLRTTVPGSNPENECIRITETALDGTQGDSSQNSCIRVANGIYYVENSVSAGGADARVMFKGENN